MSRHSRGLALLAVAAVAILAVTLSCSGDDGSTSAAGDPTTATPSTGPDTSAAQPPGTDPAEVEPYITNLLHSYDEVTSQITADPEAAADPENELYDDLRELMAPDSQMTEAIIGALSARGRRGVSQQPYDEGELPVTREVDGDVHTVSENEVTFAICTRLNYRLFNRSGQQTEFSDGRDELGEGTAVRVDGHWLLSRLDARDDPVGCQEEQR